MSDEPTSAVGAQPREGEGEGPLLLRKRHVQYFKRVLAVLPSSAASLDTSRMTLLFFALSGLDVLQALDSISAEEQKQMVEWIYAQQVLPDKSNPDGMHLCGFRGASFLGIPFAAHQSSASAPYDCSHVAMTYTALACLLILGDDLSRVNRPAVLSGLRQLQKEDGSFSSTVEGSENDMRFVFCACCVCYMLNDWSAIDTQKTVEFIRRSQGYDYGVGQGPFLESHGGSTFCAVASLVLMGELGALPHAQLEGLKRWCVNRQITGFQGRPNKPVDTCYSFWVGASLELMGCSSLVDKKWNRSYIFSTQGEYTGGFSKWPDSHPDPMHSYLGLCGLALNGEAQLRPIHAALNISKRAADWLHQLQ